MELFRQKKLTGWNIESFVSTLQSGRTPGDKQIIAQRKAEISTLLKNDRRLHELLCVHLAYVHDLPIRDILKKFDEGYLSNVIIILSKRGITLDDKHPEWYESTAEEIVKGEMASIISETSGAENA